jgi:hypothetical protein
MDALIDRREQDRPVVELSGDLGGRAGSAVCRDPSG